MQNRKPKGWAWWATVAVLVTLVAYPLSLGPATWLHHKDLIPTTFEPFVWKVFYRPIVVLHESGPLSIARAIEWYSSLWDPDPEPATGID